MAQHRIKADSFDKFYFIIGLPWLFLMLFTSRMYTEIKTVMLGVLVVIGFLEFLQKKMKTNYNHIRYVLFFVLYSLISLLYGILAGYDFNIIVDYALIQYFMITPICVLLFSVVFSSKKNRITFLWGALKYLTLLLVILDVLRIALYMIGIDPAFFQFIMIASDNFQEELSLRVSNEPSLMFLVPIYVYILINPEAKNNRRDQACYFLIFAFAIVYAVFSGRKMLQLVIALSILVSFVHTRHGFSMRKFFRAKVVIISIICIIVGGVVFQKLSALMGIDDLGNLVYETIVNNLSSEAEGVTKREENTRNLLSLWLNSPLWGNGLNSYVEGSLANSQTKWSYEVVYVAWLAQTGVIGVYLLCVPIVYIFKRLKKKTFTTGDARYFAIALGFISFIICGASNPMVYLVWPWSICLIFCNEKLIYPDLYENSYYCRRPGNPNCFREQ